MKIEILSLFPEYFTGPFDASMIKRARESGAIEIGQVNIRDFAHDKHKTVDDRPFGGGAGMVLKAEPILEALQSLRCERSHVVYMTPRGKVLTSATCQRLAQKEHLIILSGHYEGIDERVLSEIDEEISIGDYVLTDGCVAAIVVVNSVVRFVPGVLGDARSSTYDSFSDGLLEHAHYTRPMVVQDMKVPEVLLGGDHKKIANWRRQDALKKTFAHREDLYVRYLGETEEDERPALILEVECLVKSIKFYRKLLGLRVESETEDRATLSLDKGRRLILVAGREKLAPSSCLHQMRVHEEESFVKIEEKLRKEASFLEKANERTMYFRDLDGHLWMIDLYKN